MPVPTTCIEIGTAAVIHRMLRAPDGTVRLDRAGHGAHSHSRIYFARTVSESNIELAPETVDKSVEVEALDPQHR